MLRTHGQDMMALFNVALDRQDDRDSEADVDDKDIQSGDKFAYVVRKLIACGWFQIDKDYKTSEELVFLPAYSIRMLELLDQLTSDISTYMPLVHQTYSELSLEDKTEDDYMYRSLANAVKNADELELSVTLLHHSIVVYNHKLTSVFSPNDALHQHFDDFKKQVGDSIYHPMKTYDSLGLYSRPTISILTRWLRDERIIARLAGQCKVDSESTGKHLSIAEATDKVIHDLNFVIDVFGRLNKSFDEIDIANSNYTEAVQKKVNYLSGADKSMKGKLDKICSSMANEYRKNPSVNEENSEIILKAVDSIEMSRVGIFDEDSLFMPFKREKRFEEDPLGLQDDMALNDDGLAVDALMSASANQYSDDIIEDFMRSQFGSKQKILSTDVQVNTLDDLILLIFAIVRAEFNKLFFTIEKVKDEEVIHNGYKMPLYQFTKKKGS